jgi:hypothetical protein
MTTAQKGVITLGAAIAALYWIRTKASGGNPVPRVTTSEGFDLSPYGGPIVYPTSIVRLGQAIARAEGFYVKGSIPQRAHNPGDLKPPNWSGPTLGEGIAVYASDDAGWAALHKQLYAILTGRSSVYDLDMTIHAMAAKWTGGDNPTNWARAVATTLGVTETTPLYQVIGGAQT